jgi:hypothetical protein
VARTLLLFAMGVELLAGESPVTKPCREDDASYENTKDSVRLAGALAIPEGKGPFPAEFFQIKGCMDVEVLKISPTGSPAACPGRDTRIMPGMQHELWPMLHSGLRA